MPSKTSPKYRHIAQELKKAIRTSEIRPGSALPSHSELMSQYTASLSTVRQAISELASEGWVRAEHGRGVFAEQLRGGQPGERGLISSTVGFAVFGQYQDMNPVHQIFLHGAASELHEHDRDVAYGIFRAEEEKQEQFARFLDRVSAVMICQQITSETLETLREGKIPTVVVGHMPSEELPCDEFHNVYADMDGAGYLATQSLAIHGHQKVAMITRLPLEHPATHAINRGMQMACDQYGVIDGGKFYSDRFTGYLELARHFADDPELTGLVVMGDHGGIMLAQAFAAVGITIPDHKSVVCIGGLPREMLVGWETPLTRVNINYRMMGQEAARLLLSSTQATIHKSVPATLEKGQTLKMIHGTGA